MVQLLKALVLTVLLFSAVAAQTSTFVNAYGTRVVQNPAATSGGYLAFEPLTYPPNGGSTCYDIWHNVVTQPLAASGMPPFGADTLVLWNSTSPMIPVSGCGIPLPAQTDYGLNLNGYFLAMGGLSTLSTSYASVSALGDGTLTGGASLANFYAGGVYPIGTLLISIQDWNGTHYNNNMNAAGSGYAVGDLGTIPCGTTNAVYKVLSIGGGGGTGPVATYEITSPGAGCSIPASAVATTATSGGGTGFKLNLTGLISPLYVGGSVNIGHSCGPPTAGTTIQNSVNPLPLYLTLQQGLIYHDDCTDTAYELSNDLVTWRAMTRSGTPGGPLNAVQINNPSGTFAGYGGFLYNPSLGQVSVNATTGSAPGMISPIFNANIAGLSGAAKTFQNSDQSWSADYQGNIAGQTISAGVDLNAANNGSGGYYFFFNHANQILSITGPTTSGVQAHVFSCANTGTALCMTQASDTFGIQGNGDASFQDVAAAYRITSIANQTVTTASQGTIEEDGAITNNASGVANMRARNTFNGSGNAPVGIDMVPTFAPSTSISFARGAVVGGFMSPPAGVTITDAVGMDYALVYAAAAAGSVTNGTTIRVYAPAYQGSVYPTNQYGIHIQNQGAGGVTNVYGLYIDAQTGGTHNIPLYVNGTGTFTSLIDSSLVYSSNGALTTDSSHLTWNDSLLQFTVSGTGAIIAAPELACTIASGTCLNVNGGTATISAAGVFTGQGITVSGTNFNQIQVVPLAGVGGGGMTADTFTVGNSGVAGTAYTLEFVKTLANPGTAASNTASVYLNTSNQLVASISGAAASRLCQVNGTGCPNPAASLTNTGLVFVSGGSLATDATDIYVSDGPTNYVVNVAGPATTSVASGFAGPLFNCLNTGTNVCMQQGSQTFVIYGNGDMKLQNIAFGSAAAVVSSGQVSFGSTVAGSSSCGLLTGAAGCLIINVAGTTRYVPYY